MESAATICCFFFICFDICSYIEIKGYLVSLPWLVLFLPVIDPKQFVNFKSDREPRKKQKVLDKYIK